MACQAEAPPLEKHEVTYYVNRDSAGWVEQRVRRRVYIELKLECTRNRSSSVHKARDDWLCLYCRGTFPSKLRLTDHRVGGCPCGPVDSTGSKWELPVYPNLKTAKQGKDLKLTLQRGDRSVWDNLHNNTIWLDLNPELRDPTYPPRGARVHKRRFLEPTLDTLTACPPPTRDFRPQGKPRPERPSKQHTTIPLAAHVIDFEDDDDNDNELEPPLARIKKRSHVDMETGHSVSYSSRQFRHRKQTPMPSQHNRVGQRPSPHLPQSAHVTSSHCVYFEPPPHPIRMTLTQSRSPSRERVTILAPTPAPHAPFAPPIPFVTPVCPMDNSTSSQAVALRFQKDRHVFYVTAISAARASVKIDIPKPALKPPIQPPGLFHLLGCGLLKFDLECGEFHVFQEEVDNWQNDPSFMDRLFAAYGRFYSPTHQVQADHVPHTPMLSFKCMLLLV